jgi:hypothetical protein
MPIAIAPNQDETLTPPPLRADDSPWPFALLALHDTIYGDSLTDLVGYLIPDYEALPASQEGDEDAFLARVDYAAAYIGSAQSVILATATTDGDFAPELASEATLTALLSPRGTGLIDGSEFNFTWTETVPLLLLTTDFAPFTSVPLIDGNVAYFDPSDERVFLDSLSGMGAVELFVNAQV